MTTVARVGLDQFRKRVVSGSFPCCASLPQALRELLFVQADPIRSPARAQDLILRQRVNNYRAGDLELAFPDFDVEEGYLFAYGFMTPEVWRELRGRPHGKLKKLEREVLDLAEEMDQIHPRDLDEKFGQKSVRNYWGGKSRETKQALDRLQHYGYLRVCRRENGIRVYQLAEDPKLPTLDPVQRYSNLVRATARVFGPTTVRFLVSELRPHNHLLPTRKDRIAAIEALHRCGELESVEVDGVTYTWKSNEWASTEVPDSVRILAPFDPLVRDRERFTHLWNWDYRFEAYVPAAQRERGYYAMPVLWRHEVVGWANAQVEDARLQVELGFAGKQPRSKSFRSQVEAEVEAMAVFLGLASGDWQLAF